MEPVPRSIWRKHLSAQRISALAGAFLVGVGGAKWITAESNSQLHRKTIKEVGPMHLSPEESDELVQGSALQIHNRAQKIKAAKAGVAA